MIRRLLEFPRKDLAPGTQRRGTLLNILLFGVWTITLVTLVMLILTGALGIMNQPLSLYLMAGAILIAITGLYVLNQQGRVTLAGVLFLVLLSAATSIADAPNEVLAGRTLLFFTLPILMASFLLEPYASFIAALFIVIVHGIMWIFADVSVPFSPFGMTAFMVMALIAWLAARSLEEALNQAREVNLHLDELVGERTQELAEANAYLEITNERLQELDVLKSKFVSDVSHELRTPISNISIYLEMLEDSLNKLGTTLPQKVPNFINVAREETKRLTKLINDILDSSHLEQSAARTEMQVVDMNKILRDVVDANRLKAEAKGIALNLNETNVTLNLLADPDQLTQVFTNLTANAINYTPTGSIDITTALDDKGQAILQIRDTGMGIASEDMAHLFDRFYRGKQASRSSIPGTGLGLAITKEIVETHQGSIAVESELNVGTLFTITFPIYQPEK